MKSNKPKSIKATSSHAPKVAVTRALPPGAVVNPPKLSGPPPIIKRSGPPPIVAAWGKTAGEFPAVVAAEKAHLQVKHRPPMPGATHIIFRSIPDKDGAVSTVVVPIGRYGDFSSARGTVSYGKLIGPEEFRYAPGEAPALWHPPVPVGSTHFEFILGDGTVMQQPLKFIGEYEFRKGKLRFGTLHGRDQFTSLMPPGGDDYVPHNPKPAGGPPPIKRSGPPPIAGVPAARKTRVPSAGGKREGVCGFIDNTIEEADGKLTVEEVLAIVIAKFPERDPGATMSTIRARPSHMRAAGKTPKAFKK